MAKTREPFDVPEKQQEMFRQITARIERLKVEFDGAIGELTASVEMFRSLTDVPAGYVLTTDCTRFVYNEKGQSNGTNREPADGSDQAGADESVLSKPADK